MYGICRIMKDLSYDLEKQDSRNQQVSSRLETQAAAWAWIRRGDDLEASKGAKVSEAASTLCAIFRPQTQRKGLLIDTAVSWVQR